MSAKGEMAKDFTSQQLHGIKASNNHRFERLDWTGVGEETLEIFFPKINKYGKLHPPESYLTCAKRVRAFRKLGRNDQQHAISEWENQQAKNDQSSRRRRGTRPRSGGGSTVTTPPAKANVVSTVKKRKVQISQTTPPPKEATGWNDEGHGDSDEDMGGDGLSTPYDCESKQPPPFFPISTYEDAVWTSLAPVVLAWYYLPKFTEYDINQMRLGSDPCEATFNMKRGANPNASKRDTDNIMSHLHGGVIMQMAASRKGNVGKQRIFVGSELTVGKIKRKQKQRRQK